MTGRDSSVSIAIMYGLDSPGFEFRCAKRFTVLHTDPDRSCDPHSLLRNVYLSSFPGVKWPGRSVDSTPPSGEEVKRQ